MQSNGWGKRDYKGFSPYRRRLDISECIMRIRIPAVKKCFKKSQCSADAV
ncbi:hypothetical protein NEILACOT_03620 [Neisseria lactamica ATCC 23970]|uniref:Uncharacterized protein n=1 Tax=Neisseria lactamica ATCC 23970 TaxID=546265 RepID=D0W7X0_NEILA|nr:hypothetical protein NEILACOT_03620 [Neisseria lactamica ATCC 23970]